MSEETNKFQKAKNKVTEVMVKVANSVARKKVSAFNKELLKKKKELEKASEGTGTFDALWMITEGYEKYIDTMIGKTSEFLSKTEYIDVSNAVKEGYIKEGSGSLNLSTWSDLSAQEKMLKEISNHISNLKSLSKTLNKEEKVFDVMESVKQKVSRTK